MEASEKANTGEYYNILITPSMDMFLPAMVTMLSAIKNGGRPCHFYIMQNDFSEESKEVYRKLIGNYPGNRVDFIDVNDEDFKIFKPFKGHYGVYYKLLAHEYLPLEVKRILHVEPDVMIRKNIEDFYFEDFEDSYFLATWNMMEMQPRLKARDFHPEQSKRALRASSPCNHGFLLINAEALRINHVNSDVYKKAIDENRGDYFYDSGLINYLFWERKKYVPSYKWQTMICFIECYKKVFALDKQTRIEQYNEFYAEEFDEKHELSTIHFVLSKCARKPWETIYKDGHVYDDNGKQLLPVEEPFYLEWWQIAFDLPKEYFWKLLVYSGEESRKMTLKGMQFQLSTIRNAANFFSELCLDLLGERKFERFMQSLAEKKIAVLKVQDRAGKFFLKVCENADVNIVFTSQKHALDALTAEELAECRKADVVITCCVHGTKTHERDGVKCIDIWDILRDDSLTKDLPAITAGKPSSETLAAIAEEAKLAKEMYEHIERLMQGEDSSSIS